MVVAGNRAEPWKILEEWKKRKKVHSEGTQSREVNYSGGRKRTGGESSLRKKQVLRALWEADQCAVQREAKHLSQKERSAKRDILSVICC